MAKRDEMLAVIRERNNEIVRHMVLAEEFWSPLWWYHRREMRRLLALNRRDIAALPPQRYRSAGPAQVQHD